jgi:hypothetical protein
MQALIHCRKNHVTIHDPRQPVYCDLCLDYVLVDNWHKCLCCYSRVKRRRPSVSDIIAIEEVVQQNISLVTHYAKAPYVADSMLGAVVKLGHRTYLVSIADLADYYRLKPATPDEVRSFLRRIEKKATIVYPGTKIV